MRNVERTCANCGVELISPRWNQRTCSAYCKLRLDRVGERRRRRIASLSRLGRTGRPPERPVVRGKSLFTFFLLQQQRVRETSL